MLIHPFILLFRHHFRRTFFSVNTLLCAVFLLIIIAPWAYYHMLHVQMFVEFADRGLLADLPPLFVLPLNRIVSAQEHSFVALTDIATQTGKGMCLFYYLREAARALAFFLPIISFIFSYRTVSKEVESGLANSLYSLPVRRCDLAWVKIFSNTISFIIVAGITIGAITIWLSTRGARGVPISVDIARIGIYGAFIVAFFLVFSLVGMLISALARRSSVAMVGCLVAVMMIFAVSVARDGISAAFHPGYPEVPEMSPAVSMVFSSRWVRPEDEATPEMIAYMADLHSYNVDFYNRIRSRYHIERFLNFLSPANLHIEVASALLQDRFIPPYRIFAPVRLDEAQATIGQSLRYLLPEILFTLAMIMLLFWLNVRALTKLEV